MAKSAKSKSTTSAAPATPETSVGIAMQAAMTPATPETPAAPSAVSTDGHPLVAALTAAAKPSKTKRTPEETIRAYLPAEQAAAMLTYIAEAKQSTTVDKARAVVALIGPAGVPYKAWKPLGKAIRALSTYAYMCLCEAYRDAHKALPNAGKGSGEGGKGMSPERAVNALTTKVLETIKYFENTVSEQDINETILDAMSDAFEAFSVEFEAFRTAVLKAAA